MPIQLSLVLKHCSSVSFSWSCHQLMLCRHRWPWAWPGKALAGYPNMFLSLNTRAPKLHSHLEGTYCYRSKMSKKGVERTSRKRHLLSESLFILLCPCLRLKENSSADLWMSGAALSPGCKHRAGLSEETRVRSIAGRHLVSGLDSEHLLGSAYLA